MKIRRMGARPDVEIRRWWRGGGDRDGGLRRGWRLIERSENERTEGREETSQSERREGRTVGREEVEVRFCEF